MSDVHKRTSRLNRIVFVLLGLLLIAGGLFLLGRNLGWFDALPASDPLYSRPEARLLHRERWIFPVGAIVAAVIALLTLRWILVQPRIDRVQRLRVDADHEQRGRTVLASDVLTDAVEDDIEQYPGVVRSRVFVTGAADEPEFVVRVAAQAGADLAELHRRVVTEALASARTALDSPAVPAQVHLVITSARRGTTTTRVVE